MKKRNAGSNAAKRPSPKGFRSTQTSQALQAAKKKAQQKNSFNAEILIDDPYQVAEDAKYLIKGHTAMVTEPRMAEHRCLWDDNYPECPERLTRTIERCQELELLDRCLALVPQLADDGDILAVHTQDILDLLKGTRGSSDIDKLEQISSDYDAIYIHPTTYELAVLAAGSATSLVKAVCNGKAQNGMAFIRPPGHHAMESEFCGYCFFNNAAVAVTRALNEKWAQRVLIVDWDVHHGQATQQAFYNDPRVLYFSIHRYEMGQFWPNLEESNFNYIGEEDGIGYNVNVPLNKTGMGDADYLAIFKHVLLPIAQAGEMEVTPACYAHLTNLLSTLAGGKIVVLLEGGYCLSSLAESAAMTLRALLGDPCPALGDIPAPSEEVMNTILNTIYALRPYWEVFKHHPTINEREVQAKIPIHIPKVTYLGPEEPAKKPFLTRNCYPVQSDAFKSSVEEKLQSLITAYNLTVPAHRVGLIYSEEMLAHRNEQEPGHVESPFRASGIFQKHQEYNLIERCHRLEARKVKEDELLTVHTRDHVFRIQATKGKPVEDLITLAESYNSIYLHPETYSSAELAAGCVLQAVDSVLTGSCLSAVAIVRPPGHHAEKDTPCGFCLFNNVAVAAKHAVNNYKLQRVLLLDWDVHHGNGTQQIFDDDPRVMYISLHRYDNGTFFPASMSKRAAAEAASEYVGTGAGAGYSVNIAWNKRGMTDADYITAFLQVILPVAYQYNPELVLISAGFDAAARDPLGGCKLSPEGYSQMTRWLQNLAGGRVVLALEGGYNVSSISYSLTMCTKALLGDPIPQVKARTPCPSAINSIRSTQRAHFQYWSTLALYNHALPSKENLVQRGSYKPKVLVDDLVDSLCAMNLAENKPPVEEPQDADKASESTSSKKSASSENESQPGPSSSSGYSSDIKTFKSFIAECFKSSEEMYALIPRSDCPHLDQLEPVPEEGIDMTSACQSCENLQENWVCLHCYTVHCGRFINQHMEAHSIDTSHPLVISQADLSVWCYGCDAYVDAPALYDAKNSAHRKKFGEDMPWTYDTPVTINME